MIVWNIGYSARSSKPISRLLPLLSYAPTRSALVSWEIPCGGATPAEANFLRSGLAPGITLGESPCMENPAPKESSPRAQRKVRPAATRRPATAVSASATALLFRK